MTSGDFQAELSRYLRCAICQKRVDSVSRDVNLSRCEVTYTAHCHGKSEAVSVPGELLDGLAHIDIAPAFAGNLLAAPERGLLSAIPNARR